MPVNSCIPERPFDVKLNLSDAWAGWLKGFDWNWYCHFTFRPNERVIGLNRKIVTFNHPENALKSLKKLTNELNKEIFGERFHKRPHEGIIMAAAMERQANGNPHFHAVAGNIPESVRRMGVVDWWFQKQGIARVYEYIKDGGAEEYLSKMSYCFKDGKAEIFVLGPLTYMQPHPVLQ